MLRLFGYAMCLGFLSLGWGAGPATTSKKVVKKAGTSKKSGTSKAGSSKSGSKATPRRASTAPARKAASWRSRQLAPTPERYRQIQGALVAKGYLQPDDATGAWNSNSIDAMKRFQADQKIEGSGKINSLSLIALGLGPKRENLANTKPQQQPPPPAQ